MKTKNLLIILVSFKSIFLSAQITIGKTNEKDTISKNKTLSYNGYDNFKLNGSDYNMYIGLKFYNPPTTEEYRKSNFEEGLRNFHNENLISSNFNVFTDTLTKIDLEDFVGKKFYQNAMGTYSESENIDRDGYLKTEVKYIYSVIYKPKPILDNRGFIKIINNPDEFNNKYFTLIDVLSDKKYDDLIQNINDKIKLNKDFNYNKFGKDAEYKSIDLFKGILFKFQDNITKKEFYMSEKYIKKLILVPFFENQKALYDTKKMVKSELNNQNRMNKKETIEDLTINDPNLIYKCEVTLLKEPDMDEKGREIIYKLVYRLTNDIGESFIYRNEVDLLNNYEFIELYKKKLNDNIKEIENERRVANDININNKLIENKKKEENKRVVEKNIKIKKEKEVIFRNKMISLYGKELGQQIVDGKVKIGMSKKICGLVVGDEIFIKKRTILKNKTFEIWTSYFNINKKLFFEDDILVRIDE